MLLRSCQAVVRQPREEAGQTLVGLVFFLFPRSNFNLVGSCRIFCQRCARTVGTQLGVPLKSDRQPWTSHECSVNLAWAKQIVFCTFTEWAKLMREIQPVVLSFLQLPYHVASSSLAVFLFFVHLFVSLLCFFFVLSFPSSFLPFFLPFFLSFLCLYLSLTSLSVSLTTKTIFKLQRTPTSRCLWRRCWVPQATLKEGLQIPFGALTIALISFVTHHSHRSH